MSHYFPLFIDMNRRPVLIVGAGPVATGKVEQLLEVHARLTVVAPIASARIRSLAEEGRLLWLERAFAEHDLDGQLMVIAATNDDLVNALVFNLAEGRAMLANSVDDLENCNFIMAAVAQAGPIQVAVSTGGTSPTLARQLRNEIQTDLVQRGMDRLAAFLGRWRADITPHLATFDAKRAFWAAIMVSPVPHWVCNGDEPQADRYMQDQQAQLVQASRERLALV